MAYECPMAGFGFGGGYTIGIIFWIIVIILFGLFLYWLSKKNNGLGRNDENPLDILRSRYAKGEISEKEYEHMKKEMEK